MAGLSWAQTAPTPPTAESFKLPAIPQSAVDLAIATPLIRFSKEMKGGAYTNGAWDGGASILLAVASWEGNQSADKRLLEQIRYTLDGNNCICCNGGYPTQHERHITGMFAIVRVTPRIWNQLSAEEQKKVDLLMKAALVGAAFTTSDAGNPRGKAPISMDGDNNLNRDWNPNYREGMVGEMVVGPVYFGGGANAEKILNTYNHAAFVAELKAAGLTNTYKTFNWKADHPESKAPTPAEITAAIKNYHLHGKDLSDPMEIYYDLTMNTYGAKVNAGLNGGKGLNGAGMIATGAAGLPNIGKPGMLLEFDSKDAGGPRSSISYAYDGFRPNLTDQVVLLITGFWKPGSKADQCVALMNVGIPDLFYKLEHGYRDYSKGHADKGVFDIHERGWAFGVQRALWEDVVKPYHESAAK
jgi:hypothetical protein